MTKPAVRIALWAAAAVAAAGAASVAIAASVGATPTVLTAADVARQLADDPSAPSTQDAVTDGVGAGPTSSAAAVAGDYLETLGGTLVARCSGEVVSLESWSPNPGYRADHVVRGPAAVVGLSFESDTAPDIDATLTCPGGKLFAHIGTEDDDHGGHGGSNSGSGGGGDSGSGGSGSGR